MRLKIVRFALSSIATIASIAVVASLSLVGSTAQAQTLFTGSGCSGNTFQFCGSWTGTYIDSTHFSLLLNNASNAAPASNANSLFTQVAIGNVTVADPTSMTPVIGWQFVPTVSGFSGSGLLDNQFGAVTLAGLNDAMAGGTGRLFSFTFGSSIGTFTQAQTAFAGVQIGITDGGSPAGTTCISRGVLPGSATGTNNFTGTGCAPSAVPEPSTYLLMATGLIGIFVAARRRRIA